MFQNDLAKFKANGRRSSKILNLFLDREISLSTMEQGLGENLKLARTGPSNLECLYSRCNQFHW